MRLTTYDPQEIINTVYTTFVVNNAPRAMEYCEYDPEDAPTCVYRSNDGRKCAVGLFIVDADYTPDIEGKPVSALFRGYELVVDKQLAHLLVRLQRWHDSPKSTGDDLRKIAEEFGLEVPN